jgi:hypothetical protein
MHEPPPCPFETGALFGGGDVFSEESLAISTSGSAPVACTIACCDICSAASRTTGPLVKKIGNPGEDVLTVLTDVRNEVLTATREKQVPWENHALRARFYFNATPIASTSGTANVGEAERMWAWAKNTTDSSLLENFIKHFGDTPFGPEARRRLEELKKLEVASATRPPTPTIAARCEGVEIAVGTAERKCMKPGEGLAESFKDCDMPGNGCRTSRQLSHGHERVTQSSSTPYRNDLQTFWGKPVPRDIRRVGRLRERWRLPNKARPGVHGRARSKTARCRLLGRVGTAVSTMAVAEDRQNLPPTDRG